jgi:hypothetical protein
MIKCALSHDIGWVREEHPGRPWAGLSGCGCGAFRMRCPACNVPEDGEARRMPEGFEIELARIAGCIENAASQGLPRQARVRVYDGVARD